MPSERTGDIYQVKHVTVIIIVRTIKSNMAIDWTYFIVGFVIVSGIGFYIRG